MSDKEIEMFLTAFIGGFIGNFIYSFFIKKHVENLLKKLGEENE